MDLFASTTLNVILQDQGKANGVNHRNFSDSFDIRSTCSLAGKVFQKCSVDSKRRVSRLCSCKAEDPSKRMCLETMEKLSTSLGGKIQRQSSVKSSLGRSWNLAMDANGLQSVHQSCCVFLVLITSSELALEEAEGMLPLNGSNF